MARASLSRRRLQPRAIEPAMNGGKSAGRPAITASSAAGMRSARSSRRRFMVGDPMPN